MGILSKKIDGLLIMKQLAQLMHYDLCRGGHGNQEYQAIKSLAMPNEHVAYLDNASRP